MQEAKKNWCEIIRHMLADSGDDPGVVGLRADLCSQIMQLPVDDLFELCLDAGSGPYTCFKKPDLALSCKKCRGVFGACKGATEDVDYKKCQKRFWDFANRQAQNCNACEWAK